MVVEAIRTDDPIAAGAVCQATTAMGVVTMGTFSDAVAAETAFAVSASRLAVAANRVFTAFAYAAIVTHDGLTAVAAALAIPERELNKRTFAVVSFQ